MKTTDQKQTNLTSKTSLQSQPVNGACCSPACCGSNDASKAATEK